MKKPVPEDFGLTEQQCNEAKERLEHGDSGVRVLIILGTALGSLIMISVGLIILISVAKRVSKDNGEALLLIWFGSWFYVPLMTYVGLASIRESRERSKPIHRQIELYEDALYLYRQTTEQYWKSLRGVAFERSLAELYRDMGYSVCQTKGSGDDGIDLVLEKGSVKTIVQCKGHKKPVGVGVVRDLYGAMMHFGAKAAVLACPAGFTAGVTNFVVNKPIRLISASEIIEMAESICREK